MKKKEELVVKVFPNIKTNNKNHDWLSERAILAAKYKKTSTYIFKSNIQSWDVTYKSVDTVVETDDAISYPTESLNTHDLQGMQPHVPIIMLRNINQSKLSNGKRLAVKEMNVQRR